MRIEYDCKTGRGGELRVADGDGSEVAFRDAGSMMAVAWVDGGAQSVTAVDDADEFELLLQTFVAACANELVDVGFSDPEARAMCLESARAALYGENDLLAIMRGEDA